MKKILSITVLLSMMLLTFAGCGKNMVDPKEYIAVDFSGLNGKGTARTTFDYDGLEDIIVKASGLDTTDYSTLGELLVIMDAFTYDIKPTENLTNGDDIVLTIAVNEKALEKKKVGYKGGEYKIKVEGLIEATVVDPFADIEITVSGTSPFLTVDLANRSTDKLIQESIRYSTEYMNNLSNGDTITVKALFNEEVLANKGYVVETLEKDFVVEGGAEFISTYSQISQDVITKMLSENDDLMESTLVKRRNDILYDAFLLHPELYESYSERDKVKDDVVFTHGVAGGYLFHLKVGESTSWGTSYNMIMIENELLIQLPGVSDPVRFVYPVSYSDLSLSEEGEVVIDYTAVQITPYYKKAEDFKAQEVTARKAQYEIEEVTFK